MKKDNNNFKRYSPTNIISLKDNEIFVFGSNLSGFHGGGAAKLALDKFGAVYGNGIGLQGKSYAIPTKDFFIRRTLSLGEIEPYVLEFYNFAKNNKEFTFLVTLIGCGLAGYTPKDIAYMFEKFLDLENVYLPKEFVNNFLIYNYE